MIESKTTATMDSREVAMLRDARKRMARENRMPEVITAVSMDAWRLGPRPRRTAVRNFSSAIVPIARRM